MVALVRLEPVTGYAPWVKSDSWGWTWTCLHGARPQRDHAPCPECGKQALLFETPSGAQVSVCSASYEHSYARVRESEGGVGG